MAGAQWDAPGHLWKPGQQVQRELAALHDNQALRLGDATAFKMLAATLQILVGLMRTLEGQDSNQLYCSCHVYRLGRIPQAHLINCLDHWFQNDMRLVPAGPTPLWGVGPAGPLLPGCRHGQQRCRSPATLPGSSSRCRIQEMYAFHYCLGFLQALQER